MTTTILNKINNLPNELVSIIYSYVPLSVTIFLTKTSYLNNHHYIRNFINKREIENYFRSTIRRDHSFVFQQILNENYQKWFKMSNYLYRDIIYSNYIYFLMSYCIENESTNCRMIIDNLFEELGLSKNQHKKKTTKHIRWKH